MRVLRCVSGTTGGPAKIATIDFRVSLRRSRKLARVGASIRSLRPAALARRWPVLVPLAVCGGLFALYLTTLCPTVYWYDSAEYATAAAVWGIPHPPGYPVYVLLAAGFARLLPVSAALATNALSAVAGALSAAALFALVRRSGGSALAAAVGALGLGIAPVVWGNAVVAEVYTPGLALLGLVLLMAMPAAAAVDCTSAAAARRVCLAALVAGVGLGVHLSLATCGLGLAYMVVRRAWPTGTGRPIYLGRLRTPLACLVMTLCGASVFLLLPVRASMDPPLNMLTPNTPERFVWLVSGGNYRTWFAEPLSLAHLLSLAGRLQEQWGYAGTALLAVGVVDRARRAPRLIERARYAPRLLIALGLCAVGNVAFFARYRVHDIEVFLLPTVFVGCWLSALGFDAALAWLARGSRRHSRALSAALFVFALGLPILERYPRLDRSHDTGARDYAEQLVAGLPAGAVIATYSTPDEWRFHAVFAQYYQLALGRRPDVKVVTYLPPRLIGRLLREGRAVFMYAPVPQLSGQLELRREGPLYRVVRAPG